LSDILRSGFPATPQEVMAAEKPPAAAAIVVVTSVSDTSPGSTLNTEPPLNPNQPNQSRKTPIAASGMLLAGMGMA